MSDYLIKEETLSNLANSVRTLSGSTDEMTPDEMVSTINETKSAIEALDEHISDKNNPHETTFDNLVKNTAIWGGVPSSVSPVFIPTDETYADSFSIGTASNQGAVVTYISADPIDIDGTDATNFGGITTYKVGDNGWPARSIELYPSNDKHNSLKFKTSEGVWTEVPAGSGNWVSDAERYNIFHEGSDMISITNEEYIAAMDSSAGFSFGNVAGTSGSILGNSYCNIWDDEHSALLGLNMLHFLSTTNEAGLFLSNESGKFGVGLSEEEAAENIVLTSNKITLSDTNGHIYVNTFKNTDDTYNGGIHWGSNSNEGGDVGVYANYYTPSHSISLYTSG